MQNVYRFAVKKPVHVFFLSNEGRVFGEDILTDKTFDYDRQPYYVDGHWRHGWEFNAAIDKGSEVFPNQNFSIAYMDGPILGGSAGL